MKRSFFCWLLLVALTVTVTACISGTGEDKGVDGGNESGMEALGNYGYIWRRVGGIAGFCNVVSLAGDGTGTVQSCLTEPPQTIGEVSLTPDMTAKLTNWIDRYASFEYKESDPAVADGMTVVIEFTGRGSGSPAANDYAAMQSLALEVMRLAGDAR